jgi:DNA-binding response OmpR family regulator
MVSPLRRGRDRRQSGTAAQRRHRSHEGRYRWFKEGHRPHALEFTLLQIFFTHPGQVLSLEQLFSRARGYGYEPASNIVETYVRYLRRKL